MEESIKISLAKIIETRYCSNYWTKIAEKFTRSPAEAEKKFKNIRTAYHLVLEGILPKIANFKSENEKITSFK